MIYNEKTRILTLSQKVKKWNCKQKWSSC